MLTVLLLQLQILHLHPRKEREGIVTAILLFSSVSKNLLEFHIEDFSLDHFFPRSRSHGLSSVVMELGIWRDEFSRLLETNHDLSFGDGHSL